MEPAIETSTWEQYHANILHLVNNLGGYRPDVIAPCMLGGLVPGAIIAKRLGINDVRPIDIERIGEKRRLAYDVQGDVKGKKILIVEDVTTSGGSVVKTIQILRENNAVVEKVLVVVDRETGAREQLQKLEVEFIPLVSVSEILKNKEI